MDTKSNSIVKRAVAEFVGSFILMFCYMGIFAKLGGHPIPCALGMGFVFLALYYSIGKFTRCHLNPSVSLAFLIDGKLEVIDFIVYFIAQVIGACLGSLALFGFYEMVYNLDKTNFVQDGANIVLDYFQKGYTARGILGTFLVEVILTLILCFVIISVEKDGDLEEVKGLAIAAVYAFIYFAAMGMSLGCVNPARNLAACLSQVTYFEKTEGFEVCFVFIVGPIVGAILGAILAGIINGDGSSSGSGSGSGKGRGNDDGSSPNEAYKGSGDDNERPDDDRDQPKISDEKNMADSQRPINQEQVNVGKGDDEKKGTMVEGDRPQDGDGNDGNGDGDNKPRKKKNAYHMLIK